MKAFSLEEYLKNPSRKVVTKDGRKVRILCTDFNNPDFPVICGVESSTNEQLYSFTRDGSYFIGESSPCDLFFAPEKHEGWLNIYRSDECGFYMRGKSPYKSKEKADKVAKANPKTFFTTVKIEWEE